MSTHNIGFYEDLTKLIFQLSSNTHLISSSLLYLTIDDSEPGTDVVHSYRVGDKTCIPALILLRHIV